MGCFVAPSFGLRFGLVVLKRNFVIKIVLFLSLYGYPNGLHPWVPCNVQHEKKVQPGKLMVSNGEIKPILTQKPLIIC